jgi:endogenous inhibitor of DNA gyrase (YacG/DUF329 family)
MRGMADAPIPLPPRRRTPPACPICGKPPAAPHAPFCGRRCADLDLHRWLSEGYRMPAEEPPEGEPELPAGDGDR